MTCVFAEIVNCRSLSLPQLMQYDAQLQLTAYKLQCWFDWTTASLPVNGLVSMKSAQCKRPVLSGDVKLHCLICVQHCAIVTLCVYSLHDMHIKSSEAFHCHRLQLNCDLLAWSAYQPTRWWRKSSNMTVGQCSLIYLAHHCYDWHPRSRCG